MAKKKKEAGTAVAEKKQTLPTALMQELQEDAGLGQENVTRDDVALPFILLLQGLSPQLSKRDPNYVEGAKAGMFFNTVTGQLHDGEEGVRFIPVYFSKAWNEWIKRTEGGGFVNSYGSEAEGVENMNPEHDLVETANHFVLVENPDGTWSEAIFNMTSTKLKTSRKLNSLVTMKKMEGPNGKFTPPRFSFIYRLKSVETENDKGRFFVPTVEDEEVIQEAELYGQAKKFYELAAGGEAKVDYSKLETNDEDVDIEADGKPGF